jgi:hypothetical protein
MSYIGITLQIIEYHPQNFNFENFSFVFSTESRDFEKEISFSSKDPISHKLLIPRKNLKYSIKITRNNSLIGISDFIIPLQVFSKKENSFNKYCQLTMTDSIRKLIFGNISSNNIKIHVSANIKYLEKGEKFIKSTISNSHIKKEKKRASTPKKFENKFKNKYGNMTTILKLSKDEKSTMNKKVTEDFKKRSSTKSHINNASGNASLNTKIRLQKKEKDKEKSKDNIINNKKIEKVKDTEKAKEENKIITNIEDTSDIDESLKDNNTQNLSPSEILDFMKSFEKKYPLEKLDEFNDQYELMNHTKKIMNELLNYQQKYYSLLNTSYTLNKKYQNLLLNYNEKFRLTLKKINKIEEESKKNDIKQDIILTLENNENNNLNQLLNLKQQELQLLKEIYVIKPKKKEEEKLTEEQIKQIEEKKNKDHNTQLLLIKVLNNIYNKYGPLNKIITKENSEDNEIKNIINLSEKYNLPISEEVLKMENVICNNKPEEMDLKLESYLQNFYKNKKISKIAFKKIGNNLYEYGTLKVTIIFEDNAFKAKTVGGFIGLDKFIEKNSGLEDNKIKNADNIKNRSSKKKK